MLVISEVSISNASPLGCCCLFFFISVLWRTPSPQMNLSIILLYLSNSWSAFSCCLRCSSRCLSSRRYASFSLTRTSTSSSLACCFLPLLALRLLLLKVGGAAFLVPISKTMTSSSLPSGSGSRFLAAYASVSVFNMTSGTPTISNLTPVFVWNCSYVLAAPLTVSFFDLFLRRARNSCLCRSRSLVLSSRAFFLF